MATKTTSSLFTLAEVAINTVSHGSEVAIPEAALVATVAIDFAPTTSTAPARGTRLIIEGSDLASGDSGWRTLDDIVTGTTASSDEAVAGTEAIGDTTIEVSSTTGYGARTENIFFKNSTLGNSEWAKLVSIVSNTSITILDGLTNAQTGSTIWDQAERHVRLFDATGIRRIRLTVDQNYQATGPTVAVRASVTTYEN